VAQNQSWFLMLEFVPDSGMPSANSTLAGGKFMKSTYQFDCNFFVCSDVSSMVDVSKCATSELSGESVFAAYA
jgi:hypothetical protein